MRSWKSLTCWLVLVWAAAGCSKYNAGNADQCRSVAECNPGETCGDLVPCVDGECQPDQVISLPCSQACYSNSDCPAGMHCRVAPNDANECVADGACLDVAECQGLEHDDCQGFFECTAGVCPGHECDWQCG